MSNNPEEIRRDIERTRADLSYNVNAFADEANPAHMARRKVESVKSTWKAKIFGDPDDPWDEGMVGDVKERTQGVVGDVQDRAQDIAGGAVDVVQEAPVRVRHSAQGNPLAAGLVAFGLGALVGGLLPSTRAEQDAARRVQDKAQPVVEEAKARAQEAMENVKPIAQEAVQNVKDVAAGATEHVKSEASDAKDTVTEQAKSSVQEVRDDDRNPL